jgi:hypothetical protein
MMRPYKGHDKGHDRENQEKVNRGAGNVHRRETQYPQHEENNKQSYKHYFLLMLLTLVKLFSSTRNRACAILLELDDLLIQRKPVGVGAGKFAIDFSRFSPKHRIDVGQNTVATEFRKSREVPYRESVRLRRRRHV